MGESVSFSIFLKDYLSKSLFNAGRNSDKVFDDMEKGLDDVERKSKKTAQGMSASLGGAFSNIRGMLATLGVTLGVTAGVIGSANLGIQAEQTEVAFTTMIGSAEKAKQSVAELSDFAAKTPYGKQEVLAAGRQMLAFGFEADDLKTKLTNIGDVASGLGQPLGDMAYLFGTVKTQGKAMTMDLNQFANRGVPIFDEVAKVLGIAKNQVKDYAEEGKISYAVIEQAFANMSAEGGKFFRMMDSQSQTAGGRLGAMMDNVRALGEKLGLAMLPAINAIVDLGTVLLEKLKPVIDAIAPAFEWIGKNLNSILIVVGPLVAAFTAWSVALKVAAAYQWLLNIAMNANPIGLIVTGIALLTGGLILAYKKSDTFRGILNGLWQSIQVGWDYVKKLAGFLWEWLPLFQVIRFQIKMLGKVFTWLWPVIKNVFSKISSWISETFGGVFNWITDKIKQFIGFLGKIADALGIGKIIRDISNAFKDGYNEKTVKVKEIKVDGEEDEEKIDAISSISKPKSAAGIAAGIKETAKKGAGEKLVGVKADERATRNINVRIDKLIGDISFNSTTFKEDATELREKVKQILIDAVRDAELSF